MLLQIASSDFIPHTGFSNNTSSLTNGRYFLGPCGEMSCDRSRVAMLQRVDDDFNQPERTEPNFITKELDNDVLGHFFGSMRCVVAAISDASGQTLP
jgi:hypothetical protein